MTEKSSGQARGTHEGHINLNFGYSPIFRKSNFTRGPLEFGD